MSKKLAIKGHPTRGNEVIALLEMMGGRDVGVLKGNHDYYVIDECENNLIKFYGHNYIHCHEFVVLTLEEFLEKYPFKVGDLKDLIHDYISCVISEMRWNAQDECVEYHAEFGPNDYGWYTALDFCRDYQIEKSNTVISGINLNSCDYADEVELSLGDYEIEVRGDRTYAVKKKPKYPKTFEECLNLLYCKSILRPIIGHKAELLLNLEKLLICRDAYWKIAGEEMGLGKPWEPKSTEMSHAIVCRDDGNFLLHRRTRAILIFPTKEMRDAFYENFKDLIEQCKELL